MIIRMKRPAHRGTFSIPFPNCILCLVSLSLFLFSGCVGGMVQDMKTNVEDIKISSYMQKKQHHELIRVLQPMRDRGEAMTSFRLFLLATAYYEIRNYEKMFTTVEALEKQIARGDTEGYGGNLTVYPQILRGYAYLDQGRHDKALKEANEARVVLNRDGSSNNTFYRSQLIDVSCIAGIASAIEGRVRDADEHLKTVEDVTILEVFSVPKNTLPSQGSPWRKRTTKEPSPPSATPRQTSCPCTRSFTIKPSRSSPSFLSSSNACMKPARKTRPRKGTISSSRIRRSGRSGAPVARAPRPRPHRPEREG